MRAICQEFERQEEGERREGEGMGAEGGKASAGGSNDRILQLMQQVHNTSHIITMPCMCVYVNLCY